MQGNCEVIFSPRAGPPRVRPWGGCISGRGCRISGRSSGDAWIASRSSCTWRISAQLVGGPRAGSSGGGWSGLEGGAEAAEEGDGAEPRAEGRAGGGVGHDGHRGAEPPLDLVEEDPREAGDGRGPVGEDAPQAFRHRDHPLPDGQDDAVGEVRGRERPCGGPCRTGRRPGPCRRRRPGSRGRSQCSVPGRSRSRGCRSGDTPETLPRRAWPRAARRGYERRASRAPSPRPSTGGRGRRVMLCAGPADLAALLLVRRPGHGGRGRRASAAARSVIRSTTGAAAASCRGGGSRRARDMR